MATLTAASCDDMTGALDLLSLSTTPVIRDDVSTAPALLPTPFTFFGTSYSYASVQTNGMLQLYASSSGTSSSEYVNASIPNVDTPNGFIAPYWDDLYNPLATGALVQLKSFSTGGARVTVAWVNPLGASTQIQAKLFSTGVIEYHYCNIGTATGSSASIGVENASGTLGAAYTAGVATGMGLRFTYVP
ncbi:MAG: hypothetical protein IAE78_14195 [Myxococcus sp.]|nr:hypothetical protein [Myxococcus sp.]